MLVILRIIDWKTILTSRTYFISKLIPFTNYTNSSKPGMGQNISRASTKEAHLWL